MKKLFCLLSGLLFLGSLTLLNGQIVNGDFEMGIPSWDISGPHTSGVSHNTPDTLQYSGYVHITLGNASNSWTPNTMWQSEFQEVALPTDADSLIFWMEVDGQAWHDGGYVWLNYQGIDTILFQTGGGGGSGQSYPWAEHKVDISQWAGDTVLIYFGGHNWNGYGDHICNIRFDNIAIKTITGIVERMPFQVGRGAIKLFTIYPNPVISTTVISFQLHKKANVSLKIYNNCGQIVRNLLNGKEGLCYKEINWDGKDDSGRKLPSGIYFCRLTADSNVAINKILLLK